MAIAIIFILMVLGSVIFHFWSPWWFTPIASNWQAMDDTIALTFWLTGAVFIAVNLFIAYCVYRYRHKEDKDGGSKAVYEPENKKLEWWLTLFTTVGVLVMLAPGLMVYHDFVQVPEDAAVVEVVAQQWQWGFRFPGEDGKLGTADNRHVTFNNPIGINPNDPAGQDDIVINGSEVHFPLDQPIKVLLRSKDVLHDFYVSQFRAKMDMVPGLVSYLWLTPIRTGRFEILCAEFCGLGHFAMKGHVVVEEQSAFKAWLKTQKTFAQMSAPSPTHSPAPSPGLGTGAEQTDPSGVPQLSLTEQGRQLAQTNGCVACHTLDGKPGIGPTWKNLFGKTETMADGSTVRVDEAFVRESIVNPQAKISRGFPPIMMPYKFTKAELDALVAYTKSLSDLNDTPH